MDKEIKVLIFNINDGYYATDIKDVERIIGYEEPTKLPDSPYFIEGVINHEDHILPVVNLSKRFRINSLSQGEDSKIIVAKDGYGKIGIIVDSVSEVRDIKESTIEIPSDAVAGISKRYIKGLVKHGDKIIILLNLSSILTEEEKQSL